MINFKYNSTYEHFDKFTYYKQNRQTYFHQYLQGSPLMSSVHQLLVYLGLVIHSQQGIGMRRQHIELLYYHKNVGTTIQAHVVIFLNIQFKYKYN